MLRIPTDNERAWIVATAWANFHRDRIPDAARLRALVPADPVAQQNGLAAVEHPLVTSYEADYVSKAAAALTGDNLDEFLHDSHLGGTSWLSLPTAANVEQRLEVMFSLETGLDDEYPSLAQEVRAAAHGSVVEQLIAIWIVWTHDRIEPVYLGIAELARLALLGCDAAGLRIVCNRIVGLT